MYYVMYFLAGAFVANGVPHFVKGITGEQHKTPFGNPSSAVANVLWGSLSLVIAWVLWHYAGLYRSLDHTVRYELVFGLGGLVMALLLANTWSKSAAKKS